MENLRRQRRVGGREGWQGINFWHFTTEEEEEEAFFTTQIANEEAQSTRDIEC